MLPSPAFYAILDVDMARKIMAIAFLLLAASLPAEPMFPGYDITFFRTITDSLMVNDDKRFGIDYTGYGFVGEEMTTGVYMRIGLQAPYSSLSALFEDEEESEIEAGEPSPESVKTMLETSFSASVSIGPAFRHIIGDDMIWYMGAGFLISADYSNIEQKGSSVSTYLEMDLGMDLDMGFRINLAKHTTLRIGIHSIAPLFILQFDSMSYIGEDERQSSLSANLIPNMFLPADKREGFATEGYISLGHTYRSRSSERTYRYRVSDRTLELIR